MSKVGLPLRGQPHIQGFICTPRGLPLNLDPLPTIDGAIDAIPTSITDSPVAENDTKVTYEEPATNPCIDNSTPVLEVAEANDTEDLWLILHVVFELLRIYALCLFHVSVKFYYALVFYSENCTHIKLG